ncbi:hypothetical protein V6N13_122068 [Hibiscus sabdariffa]
MSFLSHTMTLPFISLHGIWDSDLIRFHLLRPLHAVKQVKVIPQLYKGHANYERVKCVSFFGPKSEYVVFGSDFGRIFFWKKKSGELVHVIKADKRMVNFIESHLHTAALACCGTEDIKIWTPKAIDKAVTPTQIELDQQLRLVPYCYIFST